MGKYTVIHVNHPSFNGENVPLIVKSKRLGKGADKTLKLSNDELGMNLKNFPEIHGGWILPALMAAPTVIGLVKSLFGRGLEGGEIEGGGLFDIIKGIFGMGFNIPHNIGGYEGSPDAAWRRSLGPDSIVNQVIPHDEKEVKGGIMNQMLKFPGESWSTYEARTRNHRIPGSDKFINAMLKREKQEGTGGSLEDIINGSDSEISSTPIDKSDWERVVRYGDPDAPYIEPDDDQKTVGEKLARQRAAFKEGIRKIRENKSGGGVFDDILSGASRIANIAATIAPLFGRGLVGKRSDFAGGRIYNTGGRIKLALGQGIEGAVTSCSVTPPEGKKLMVFPLVQK